MVRGMFQDGVVRKAPALVKKPPALTVEKCLGAIPRRDPLNHFKRYKGGFNVTNMHYWSVSLPKFALRYHSVHTFQAWKYHHQTIPLCGK